MKDLSIIATKFRTFSRLAFLLGGAALLASACAGEVPEDEEGTPQDTMEEDTGTVSSGLTTTGAQRFTGIGNGVGPELGYSIAFGHLNKDNFLNHADIVFGGGAENVELHLGTANGVSTSFTSYDQDNPNVDDVEDHDHFGDAVAVGDFDNNGVDDIAVGSPCESWPGYFCAGAVTIIYRSNGGGSVPSPQFLRRGAGGIPGTLLAQERFGYALATGDFNNDSYADLAIGAPFGSSAGSVVVLYGGSGGLSSSGVQQWSQATVGIPGAPAVGEHFGLSLAAGNFDGKHGDDLAIGVPDDQVPGYGSAGGVNVIYSNISGLSATSSQLWSGYQDGLSYTPQSGSQFGYSLAAGAFNTDGKADLVIGIPNLSAGGEGWAGGVFVMYGSDNGLGFALNRVIHRGTSTKVSGVPESGAHCGWAVASGDVNGDGWGDIVFGCPRDSVVSGESSHGSINVMYGPLFIDQYALQGELWHQNSPGVPGVAVSGGHFGYSLAIGDATGDGKGDVAIGAYENGIGSVTILRGN